MKTIFRSAKDLFGYKIQAADETCGKCRDFLFDDETWTVRYIVVDTGGFLTHHEVLLSPFVLNEPEMGHHPNHISVKLTREQIESSPPLATHAPVDRQYEEALAQYYNHPHYWIGNEVWGASPYPLPPGPEQAEALADRFAEIRRNHLRGVRDLMHYQVMASGEEIGAISDVILEVSPWTIRHFVVDTGKWLPGKKVLFSPAWCEEIRWADRTVCLDGMVQTLIKDAPEFDPHAGVNRDYEGRLYDYYGRERYWNPKS